MAKKPQLLKASFEQVLLYADGPQIVLLSPLGTSKLVAVAVNEKGYELPFFAAQISVDQFYDYLNSKFDLRYLLLFPDSKRHFIFDLAKCFDGKVTLTRLKLNDNIQDKYLPDSGIFARDHTEEYQTSSKTGPHEAVFGIDGAWDLSEFSGFYGQISDIYAVIDSVNSFSQIDTDSVQKSRLQMAFMKPFQGGGSYVSMYGLLEASMPRERRLHVRTIQYNSPGLVRLTGSEAAFAEIKTLISHLSSNREEVHKLYNTLRQYLRKNSLLDLDVARYDHGSELTAEIELQSKELANNLDCIKYDDLKQMAGGNVLAVAKVLLSFYRRAEKLLQFFLEGRASLEVPEGMLKR